jgi:hypothetical protein
MKTEVYILLQRIADLQSTGTPLVSSGIFLSQRESALLPLKRRDDNVFFTALILFTLSSYTGLMNEEERDLYEQIRVNALGTFSSYTSLPDGIRLYNFWKKKDKAHFPGGLLLHRFRYFKLPDDIDDTALVWLAGGYSSDEITRLKIKVIEHAAYSKRVPYHVPSEYKELRLYSSWFGKNMPIEVDVCVITNLLYLFLESKQALNDHDEDNLKFIKGVIQSRDYINKPFRVSPNYAHPVIIYYHLVRLVARFPELFVEERRLLTEQYQELNQLQLLPLYRCVLSSSALRLSIPSGNPVLLNKAFTNETWFRAGMMSTWENPLSHALAPLPLFHLTFSCEAYAYALNAEYFLLKR